MSQSENNQSGELQIKPVSGAMKDGLMQIDASKDMACSSGHGKDLTEQQMLQMLSHLQRINLSSHLGIGLAHQVNHPLSASVNYIQCCIRKLEDENFDRHDILNLMQLANQESYRAAELITRLRRFVSQAVPRFSTLNFNHKILETVALLSPLIKEHDIDLKLQLHEDLPVFYGDRIQIEQILFNLGLNAIQSLVDHPVQEPQIVFRSDFLEGQQQLACYIIDNGQGVDPQFMPHLFEPFQTTRTHCLGLGLAMSKTLCQLHDGSITLENQENGGCLATVLMPITRSQNNALETS
jgi:two-component system sensor histidine kinase TtrS